MTIRVTAWAPGQPAKSGTFEVAVKGRERSRLKFLGAEDEGKYVVSVGNESWLLLPTSKNPIRVPASHRIRGGLAVADVARTSFADDYDAVVEREDDLDGRRCAVLRLIAKKSASVSYPVIRVWVDEKEGLYRKAVFLVASGRTAKEATFDAYEIRKGTPVLTRMTVTDALRPGTTVVEYLDYARREIPDAWFDPKTAGGIEAVKGTLPAPPSFRNVVGKLAKHYGPPKAPPAKGAFEMILWENVAYLAGDEQRGEAFELLKKKIGTSPARILGASKSALRAVAEHGILADRFAGKLREVARIALDEFDGDLEAVVAGPVTAARKALQQFPGIGGPGPRRSSSSWGATLRWRSSRTGCAS